MIPCRRSGRPPRPHTADSQARWRPVLLVHGLASNAHLWDGVAERLAEAGHPVAAVDQRGHGQSEQARRRLRLRHSDRRPGGPAASNSTGWGRGGRGPPARAGEPTWCSSWRPATRTRPAVWCWWTAERWSCRPVSPTGRPARSALAPPQLAGTSAVEFERMLRSYHPDWPESGIAGTLANVEVLADGTIRPWLSRSHHMTILRHLWEHRPGERYGLVKVPVLILPAEDRSQPALDGRQARRGGPGRRGPGTLVDQVDRGRPRPARPAPGSGGSADPRRDRAGPGSLMTRILAIMGSGETAPTMIKPHRQLFDQLGPPPVPCRAARHALRLSGQRRRHLSPSRRLLPRQRRPGGRAGRVAPGRRCRPGGPGGGAGPPGPGPLGLRRSGQPHLRPAPVGRDRSAGAAGRQARRTTAASSSPARRHSRSAASRCRCTRSTRWAPIRSGRRGST